MKVFEKSQLKDLYIAPENSNGEDNGNITIIGNSDLFHGAAVLALKASSRIVDMVFFTSPEPSTKEVSAYVKAEVPSFIWVPFEEVEQYIEKSDAVLIGPGFKRYTSENSHGRDTHMCDDDCKRTREVTERLLKAFPDKKWVIDAGSLQVMDRKWIPKNSILTPNKKEYQMLFDESVPEDLEVRGEMLLKRAKEYSCSLIIKGPISVASDGREIISIEGGNAGLTKGGTGDVLAGIITALYAKNDALLSIAAASFVQKKAAEELAYDVGNFYNADDLATQIPYSFKRLTS